MAYRISDDCIHCGKCEEVCPKKAIGDSCWKYEINSRRCISCGRCASVCPVGAPKQYNGYAKNTD